MNQPVRVLIDTDPGVDDALALLLAVASPEIDLVGCTTVIGNTPAPVGARNALAVLELAGRDDIPVAIGVDRPLVHPRRDFVAKPSKVHGDSGLGSLTLPDARRPPEPIHAVEFIVEQIRRHDGDLTLIAIGPLTNLALVSSLYPEEFTSVKQVVIMGGSQAEAGNHTSAAEYNFFVDPVAAQRVVLTAPNLHLLPLDVTHKAVLTPTDAEELRGKRNAPARAAAELLTFYETWHLETYGTSHLPMHDALAVASVIAPQLLSFVPATVRIGFDEGFLRGVSIIDRWGFDGPHNALVGHEVDAEAFREVLVSRLGGQE